MFLQVLDFGLNSTNSAVVMATAKLFLHYTLNFPQQHQQVGGCKQPLRGIGSWYLGQRARTS